MKQRKPLQRKTPLKQGTGGLKQGKGLKRTKGLEARAALKAKPSGKVQTFACVACGTRVQRRRVGKGLCRPCSQAQNAAASAAVSGERRRGVYRICATCGGEFYVEQSAAGRQYCSRKCMGLASRKPLVCVVCGSEFRSPNRDMKCCSQGCLSKRRREVKTGKLNPAYRNGRSQAEKAWRASIGTECAKCGSSRKKLHLHHVVYEQHVRREGGDVYDPRNGLTLCMTCHMRHHHAMDARIDVSILRQENVEFATELLGDAWLNYVVRYYDGADTLPSPGSSDRVDG